MSILISVDPGKSSGAAVLGYDETEVWLVESYQTAGGVGGFRRLLDTLQETWCSESVWVAEKFSPRPGGGFGQGLDSTLPLVCEGVLIDRNLLPEYTSTEKRWRSPISQYLVGGSNRADRKRRQHAFLKDSGFYRTGKDFGTPDADDARSAMAHGISYLAREVKHKPTFAMISDWVDKS